MDLTGRDVHYIDVDMQTENWINEPVVVQNDSVAFVIRVTNDGEPYNLDWAATHTLVTKVKSNMPSAMSLGEVTADNELTVNLGSSEVEYVGKARSMIQLYGNDGRVSSLEFTFEVREDIGEGYEPSESERTLIELVLGDGPRILADAEQASTYANEQGDYAKSEADKLELLSQEVSENETERIDNESSRESAEAIRVTNEDARVEAENSRESAESARELQETQRQTNTAQAITETLDAAEIARNSQGPQGERGPRGEVGPQGPQGEPGKDGMGAGTVTAVNNIEPDETGNVEIEIPDPDLSGLATEQELQGLDNKVTTHLADYIQQMGTANLQTTDKTVKGAINEVFTFGNSRKSETVDALLSVDDSLPITSNNSWQDVINAIGQISAGTTISPVTPGESLILSSTKELYESTSGPTVYVKIHEAEVNVFGTFRVSFDLASDRDSSPIGAYAHIYINDTQVGLERTTNIKSYTTFVEDFEVQEGDLVQIYVSTRSLQYRAYIRNFTIGVYSNVYGEFKL